MRGEPPPSGFVLVRLDRKSWSWSWTLQPEFVLTVEAALRELESVRLYEGDELVGEARIAERADRSMAEITVPGPLVGRVPYRLEVRTPTFVREHEFTMIGPLPDPVEALRRLF